MEITETRQVKEIKYPTILKIEGDYYVVSKKSYPKCRTDKGRERHIAICLNNGKWYDWDERGIDIFEDKEDVELFEKGTEFTIKI